jgi:hypothetical protein
MKISCHKLITYIFLLGLFLLSAGRQQVAAVETMSLTATPVRLGDDFTLQLAPGEKKQVQIKVRNGSAQEVVLESRAVDFVVAEDGATPVLLEESQADPRWSLASWLTLAPAEHRLKSEAVGVVNVLIEVPDDALPGGHYAMVYHRPVGAVANEVSGSGVSQRVGTLIYVVVTGPIQEAAYVQDFRWPKFIENGPVNFQLEIDNQSDVHITTRPVVKIYNIFGQQVANLELLSQNIFPKTARQFTGTWDKVWGLGYYKAVVEAAYGSQGGVAMATAGLWMIPVKLILFVLIVALLITILVILLRKRQNKIAHDQESELPPQQN